MLRFHRLVRALLRDLAGPARPRSRIGTPGTPVKRSGPVAAYGEDYPAAHPTHLLELMDADPERLRDTLTVEHLVAFARSIDANARPISYQRDWWDGSATAHCLLVSMSGGRRRVVSTGSDEPVLLPVRAGAARRMLARTRRSPSREARSAGRGPSPTTVEASGRTAGRIAELARAGDYVVCGYPDCGAMLPLDGDSVDGAGPCPSCGRR